MEVQTTVKLSRATPEYVLGMLNDLLLHHISWDVNVEPDASCDATLDTCVADWLGNFDVLDWSELLALLNEGLGLSCSEDQWRSVLEPADKRTLRDVCEFVAGKISEVAVCPVTLLGKPCLPAAVFLQIKGMLRHAGEDVSDVRPSTPFGSFARRHLDLFLHRIPRLAPGALPAATVRHFRHDLFSVVLIACMLSWIALTFTSRWTGWAPPLIAVLVALFAILAFERIHQSEPSRVDFGRLRTFRDLAEVIAQRMESRAARTTHDKQDGGAAFPSTGEGGTVR